MVDKLRTQMNSLGTNLNGDTVYWTDRNAKLLPKVSGGYVALSLNVLVAGVA